MQNSSSFDFVFKTVLYTFLFLAKVGLGLVFIGKLIALKDIESSNVLCFALFLLAFSITSALFGIGVVYGAGYLIDLVRYK